MKAFTEPLKQLKDFNGIKQNLISHQTPVQVTGCIDSQKCHFIGALGEEYDYKLVVTYSDMKAKEIYQDLKLYEENVYLYPAKDVIFYSADIHGNLLVKNRLEILKILIEEKSATIITTLDGGMDYVLPLSFLRQKKIHLQEAEILDIEKLKQELIQFGYERQGQVERAGEFAVRGGIIDVFPLTEECPFRIELWDEEIDTIRSFDVESQRSIENVSEITLYPASEVILSSEVMEAGIRKIQKEKEDYVRTLRSQTKNEEAHRIEEIMNEFSENIRSLSGAVGIDSYIRFFYNDTCSFFDYFADLNAIVFMDEPNRLIEKGEAVELEFNESMIGRIEKGYILPSQADVIYPYKVLTDKLCKMQTVLLSTMEYKLPQFSIKEKYDLTVKSVNPYNNNFDLLVKDLERWKGKEYRVILLCASRTRAKRLSEDLRGFELGAFYSEDENRVVVNGEIMVRYGHLHRGFEYPLIKLVIISESDIFGEEKKKKRKKKTYEGQKIHNFTDLNIGDYVVHENHGVGIYRGIEKIEVDKITKDYIKIEYSGSGILYILATGLEVIQKFAGSEAKKPKLNKLNSLEWKNTKSKVRSAVKEIAGELVQLYAMRQQKEGYQFGEDTVWQKEFEEMFPYEETEDQLNAIESVKKDMESRRIMDRLICGDVGYGKTEVAIRAAFKSVSDGKQVVFLVPTTILAQQHYNTFTQRLMDFPINVESLSRFKSAAEQKKIIEKLKKGSVDIVIGTHRILSKDIGFKNLGLLIVDEEQRFGVTHKEKVKQLKGDVDVLTLSATPIPRTLHMSLVGIRDMSVLEEPPVDRLPIQTYVLEQNEEIIREAVNRELARGGQVYYVYNRVNTISEVAASIAKLVPEANVSFAHGQMQERELEKIMFDFINGEIDVLVSTTIIETGLDISNVNTMIIEDADRLGLSQLYQLRGRVGRSNRTAYAFLMYKRNKMLKEIAEKRLQAIKEFTELGSGFKIAMRDLEIRGAGNLLGAKQHGHMEAVGYDLYCKMLNDAVKRLKGEMVEEEDFDTVVDFEMDAYIPATYMKSEFQKLDMYKRIAEIASEEEFLEMQEEMLDRFGDLPSAVNNLLNIALIKATAHKVSVLSLVQKGAEVKIMMYQKAKVDINKIPKFIEDHTPDITFIPDTSPYFHYQLRSKNKSGRIDVSDLFAEVKRVLKDMETLF